MTRNRILSTGLVVVLILGAVGLWLGERAARVMLLVIPLAALLFLVAAQVADRRRDRREG